MQTHKSNHSTGRQDRLRQHYQQWKHCWLGAVYVVLTGLIILNNQNTPYGGHFQQIQFNEDQTSVQSSSAASIQTTTIQESEPHEEVLATDNIVISSPRFSAITTTEPIASSASSSASDTSDNSSSATSSMNSTASSIQEETSVSSASSSAEPVHPAAEPESTTSSEKSTDFPAFGNAVHPVQQVPNWGAMTSPAEWERRYTDMTSADFVPIPRYDMGVLTTPMNELLSDRERNTAKITAKLYYSTRHFGQYNLDTGDYSGAHAGVDLKLAAGTAVGSVAGGRVEQVGNDASLGRYIVIEHRHPSAGTFFSIYGHLESSLVSIGQDVTAGQAIGTIGMTGQTTAPHLHLQIDRDNGTRPHQRYVAQPGTDNRGNQESVHPIEFISQY